MVVEFFEVVVGGCRWFSVVLGGFRSFHLLVTTRLLFNLQFWLFERWTALLIYNC